MTDEEVSEERKIVPHEVNALVPPLGEVHEAISTACAVQDLTITSPVFFNFEMVYNHPMQQLKFCLQKHVDVQYTIQYTILRVQKTGNKTLHKFISQKKGSRVS